MAGFICIVRFIVRVNVTERISVKDVDATTYIWFCVYDNMGLRLGLLCLPLPLPCFGSLIAILYGTMSVSTFLDIWTCALSQGRCVSTIELPTQFLVLFAHLLSVLAPHRVLSLRVLLVINQMT